MADKRTLKRKHLVYYLKVYDRKTNKLIGHLVDVTTEGIMLIGKDKIDKNTLFQMRLDLNENKKNTDKNEIWFDAESVWSSKDVNLSGFYDTGFRLINVPKEDQQKMEQWFQNSWFRD